MDWAEVGRALDAGDPGGAMASLLVAWRRSPAPYLAQLVERVSDLGQTEDRRTVPGTSTARIEAWDRIARAGAPLDLPRLADSLLGLGPVYVPDRLDALLARGADPRLAARLVAWAEERPHRYQGRASERFWRRVVQGLLEMKDPRVAPRLGALIEALRKRTYAADYVLAELLPPVHRALAEAAAAAGPTPAGARQLLGRLPGGPVPSVAVDQLVDRVYAAPADDELRWVLADALIEAGDPRGEFLSLQLRDHDPGARLTRAERQRMRALEAQHARDWLGPLKHVVRKTGMRFERGFLVACRITGHPSVSSLVDIRQTATIRELDLQEYGTRELFDRGHLASLRTLRGRCAEVFRARRPLPVTRIEYAEPHLIAPVHALLEGCACLPDLASLRVRPPYGATLEDWRAALTSPSAAPLRELEILQTSWDPAAWRRMVRQAAPQLRRATLEQREWIVEVELREDGARVTVSWEVSYGGEALDDLAALLESDLLEPTDHVTLRLIRDRYLRELPTERLDELARRIEGRVAAVHT